MAEADKMGEANHPAEGLRAHHAAAMALEALNADVDSDDSSVLDRPQLAQQACITAADAFNALNANAGSDSSSSDAMPDHNLQF